MLNDLDLDKPVNTATNSKNFKCFYCDEYLSKSKTKGQHLEHIISQIDDIADRVDKAKTLSDWMIATYDLSLKLTVISFQLAVFKDFNFD